jgi:hypothetical protein
MSEQKINVTLTAGPDEGARIVLVGDVAAAETSIRGIMRAVINHAHTHEGAFLNNIHVNAGPGAAFTLFVRVYLADSLMFGSAENVIPAVPVRDETVQGIVDATIQQAVEAARFGR